jgi:hypothetical protein
VAGARSASELPEALIDAFPILMRIHLDGLASEILEFRTQENSVDAGAVFHTAVPGS